MENGPVEIVDLPMKNSGIWWFSIVMLVYQRVIDQTKNTSYCRISWEFSIFFIVFSIAFGGYV